MQAKSEWKCCEFLCTMAYKSVLLSCGNERQQLEVQLLVNIISGQHASNVGFPPPHPPPLCVIWNTCWKLSMVFVPVNPPGKLQMVHLEKDAMHLPSCDRGVLSLFQECAQLIKIWTEVYTTQNWRLIFHGRSDPGKQWWSFITQNGSTLLLVFSRQEMDSADTTWN